MLTTDFSTLPEFIPADATEILNQWKAAYTTLVGRPLSPMQTESILIQVMAAREKIVRDDFNAGGRTQLIDFSTAPMLDYLCALVRVTRLAAQFAGTMIGYTIITGHTGVTIPAGTRVRSGDGKATFATNITTFVPAGTYTTTIPAMCQQAGAVGNGYGIGAVNVIVDPLAFVISASNSEITAGGADAESDTQLAARAKEAPDAYSNAGSVGAYKFFAKSANPAIVDVAVVGAPTYPAGEVHLFPLVVGGGTTPSPILAAVLAACNPDTVRPLCDLVFTASPSAVAYNISVDLTTYDWAVDGDVIANVGQLLNDYAQGLLAGLALDVIVAKITSISMQSGVYDVAVILPTADITLNPWEYAQIGTITVNVIGHHG
jgi:phage-related baseplate assembly protein